MKTPLILTFLTLAFGCSSAAHAVTMDFAHIGNAGNAGDVQSQGTFGAVAYNYAISKTEVTNAQYTEFLNAVAGTDTYGLHNPAMAFDSRGGIVQNGTSGNYTYVVKADAQSFTNGNYTYANKPVVYVSWYDSIRFMNWMHNGQGLAGTPSGDTETGAYTLEGGTATPSNGLSITRNASAKYWLPSEDEWYKAAYHDASAGTAGTYFNFATGTNDDPDNFFPTLDAGNSANYKDNGSTTTGDLSYPLTDVGAYSLSASPYGTYDQNGNAWEWNDTLVSASLRGQRGGGANSSMVTLAASNQYVASPANETSIGFRVATVPEPSSLLMLVGLASGMLLKRSR